MDAGNNFLDNAADKVAENIDHDENIEYDIDQDEKKDILDNLSIITILESISVTDT